MSVPDEIIAAAAAAAAKARQKVLASHRTIVEAEFEEYDAFCDHLKKLGFSRDHLSPDEKATFEFGGFPQVENQVDCLKPISFSDALKLPEAEVSTSGESENDDNLWGNFDPLITKHHGRIFDGWPPSPRELEVMSRKLM